MLAALHMFTPEPLNDGQQKALRMLILLDGKLGQIKAIMERLISKYESELIEVFKLPGGTSLMYQPLDLMPFFMMVRPFLKSDEYKHYRSLENKYHIPDWVEILMRILKAEGMSKASIDTFRCFFSQTPIIFSHACTTKLMQSGWRKSGLFPQ
jgi:hypothetical protein